MAAKTPTKAQVVKYLTSLAENDMTHGNKAAVVRTIQIVKGERKLRN